MAGAMVRKRWPDALPDKRLVLEVPHHDVAVAAAGEADFGVRADGQGVAGGGRGGQLGLDPGRGGRQVPDGEGAGFPTDDKAPSVRKQLAGPDVVLSVLRSGKRIRRGPCECRRVPPLVFIWQRWGHPPGS